MLIKLAWRNIWRNKRRTAITVASVFFAVFFAVFMRSMQLGVYNNMIDSMVRFYSGHIQVHAKGYWEDQNLNNAFRPDQTLLNRLDEQPHVEVVAPRLEGFALSSSGEVTRGVLILGGVPEREDQLMDLSSRLIDGTLLQNNDRSVLLGQKLAVHFGLQPGDTLVFISQGYHGTSAAGKYPVAGIVRFAAPMLNERAVMLPISEAQYFFGADSLVTSIAVAIDDPRHLQEVKQRIASMMDTTTHEVMDWKEAMPELVQAIQADSAGGLIILFILYMIVGFGMFGTMLMLTQERRYEYGVLLSIGMSRFRLWAVAFLEGVITTFLGGVAGVIGVYPLVLYFYHNPYELTGDAAKAIAEEGWNPVMPASLDPSIALDQLLVIGLMALAVTAYPAWVIYRLNPVEARRN